MYGIKISSTSYATRHYHNAQMSARLFVFLRYRSMINAVQDTIYGKEGLDILLQIPLAEQKLMVHHLFVLVAHLQGIIDVIDHTNAADWIGRI